MLPCRVCRLGFGIRVEMSAGPGWRLTRCLVDKRFPPVAGQNSPLHCIQAYLISYSPHLGISCLNNSMPGGPAFQRAGLLAFDARRETRLAKPRDQFLRRRSLCRVCGVRPDAITVRFPPIYNQRIGIRYGGRESTTSCRDALAPWEFNRSSRISPLKTSRVRY